ncbi:hypothetical protein Tco_0779752 [Tanacetum coccineum]
MAESSKAAQTPLSPEITPKEEPITLDKPESPNPFSPVDQVEFTFDEITFTTNNEGFAAALAVLVIETSQSKQHESRKSPTVELFDVDSGRISIHHCEY